METTPTVADFMTKLPQTIGADQSLSKADKMMRDHGVRHLPVLSAGELVGILSDRDVRLVETLRDVDPEKVSVDEAYTPDPYVIEPTTPVSEVCKMMAQRKYGCALVCVDEKLVGIFTWIDALEAFSELLEKQPH